MPIDRAQILSIASELPYIHHIEENGGIETDGAIRLFFTIEGEEPLAFDMHIQWTQSPLRLGNDSPLQFFNKELMAYPHVMEDGHVCLHTPAAVTWEDRIRTDIEALHQWVEKYYVRKEKDGHYEDLVVEASYINGKKVQFYYTQMDVPPVGDYGLVFYSKIASHKPDDTQIETYIVQGIKNHEDQLIKGEWSESYQNLDFAKGVYVMLNASPSIYDKFAMDHYSELTELCTEEQWQYLYRMIYVVKNHTPIFFGYTTPNGKLRWLVTYPTDKQKCIVGKKVSDGRKTKWKPEPMNEKMHKVYSSDSSYEQFFGRGRFPDAVVKKRILIMGVGALGSGVATTLVRCGTKDITLCDFDDKHPGNVCRSEYMFQYGLTKKTQELQTILESISPFVKVTINNGLILINQSFSVLKQGFESELNQYDIIFDCTIDSELMWALDQLDLHAQIVNLSISNGAKDLVCAFSPNICEFVTYISQNAIDTNDGDMFNPEGCWSPTFKASYNDVQIMLQYALRYVVKMLSGEMEKKNFTIREKDDALQIVRW